MTTDEVKPYDFSPLDDLYLSSDEYDDIANFMCNAIRELEETAWADFDAQIVDNSDEYLRKYVIAQWRTFELDYAENAAARRGRVLPFPQAIILDVLLRSDETDEDVLALTAQYTREELLQKVSEASVPWLTKYNVRLNYDSEVEFKDSKWEIFIDAKTDPDS